MNHLSDHDLVAYRDKQLSVDQSRHVQQHLADCHFCLARFEQAQTRGETVQKHLAVLNNTPALQSPSLYRARLETRLNQTTKEQNTMFKFFSKHRTFSAFTLVILLLAISLAIPPVRAFAAQVLALFRVQDTSVLPVNISNLPDNYTEAAKNLFYLVSEDTQYTTSGQTEQVESAESASQSAGFEVRLPDLAHPPSALYVEPWVNGTFTVNLEKAQALLAEMNRSDLQLPQTWDGANISFSIPHAVIAEYNGCSVEEKAGQDCMVFVQIPSPTISAPENVDVRQVGQILLQLSGMTAEEAEAYSSQIDWLSTLIIPVPQPDASYESVIVDGVKGTLIKANSESQEHVLIWVKNNII
ncbi:MAG TPA: hypothetical protein VFF78_05510, partial [Anaerolineaceae bacterium]|nr:hypothetical protein [Anaerolineaceae bacterium]